MQNFVSAKTIQEKIHIAILDDNGDVQLRDFISDFYAGEEDNEYIFENENVRTVFDVLAIYLEYVEAYGDPFLNKKLRRLKAVMEIECTPEIFVLAIYMDSIAALINKLSLGIVSEVVFQEQLRKLTPIRVNWEKILKLFESYSDMLKG